MRQKFLYIATAFFAATLFSQAQASTFDFSFFGGGTSGTVALTYGTTTDSTTPSGYEVTGISGTFTDTNIGITNATITGLVPINYATPELGNDLAPHDFSRFGIVTGSAEGGLTFDNLFYPGGSPQTADSYPFHGGFVDIYGLLFTLNNGDVVDFYSNGITPTSGGMVDYGVGVATSARQLDYLEGGVVAYTPEPGSLCLLVTGVAGVLARRRFLA